MPATDGVVRWRLIDLAAWAREAFGISISEATHSRELKALGYSKLSARPRHHPQTEKRIATFKKTSPPAWRRSATRSRAAPR